ncbi:efflux RND transporter periplasmic adaptor subunit [Paenibacillus sp. MBLB4367]|uniref:efflux RND transporter periplasmic adaptor subunit n=1 Tax=Paenibacillus sp. MBLB4367 TaxID=3384767 RepID=UPI003908178A
MFMRWLTARFARTPNDRKQALRLRAAARLSLAAAGLLVVSGCSLLPQEPARESLPTIRPPKISQKPEYPVTKGMLELKASGTGKLMSLSEEPLYFTEDGRRIQALHVKSGDTVQKGQLIAELEMSDLEAQIRQKDIQVAKAEIDLKEALRKENEQNASLLAKQRMDYELSREELARMKERLAKGRLTAPYAGTIVSLPVKQGDMARAYDEVAVLADLTRLTVAAKFGSDDLKSVAVGMDVTVDINTAGTHQGKVKRLPVNASSDSGSGSGKSDDSPDDYVLIELDKPVSGLNRGTPLTASIVTQRKENALSIPLAALRTQNARNYALVSDGKGGKGEVDVEVGMKTSTDAEIVNGLKEGQKVVGK